MPTANGLDELNITLGAMIDRSRNMLPAYQEIGLRLASSIQENFRTGGRPDRWKESGRARKQHGQTLLDTGRLMREASLPKVTPEGITFGSTLPYARIHQEGGEIQFAARSETFRRRRITRGEKKGQFKKGTEAGRGFTRKAYTVRMPARAYIVFQPEDVEASGQILTRHLLGH